MVKTLPWLDGVKLSRQGAGFAPLAGMASVAELLAQAKLEAAPLYRDLAGCLARAAGVRR